MSTVIDNAWLQLRQFTRARIALGRAGQSLPTAASLQFQWDHASARDAVHRPLDIEQLKLDLAGLQQTIEVLHSQADSRSVYLQRPDLGRRLLERDRDRLKKLTNKEHQPRIALILVDGLSATALQKHAPQLLSLLIPELLADGITLNPLCIVSQGRVAIGDDIGQVLAADLSVVLIGERPGLSSPDSLGMYLTYAPQCGRSDAERNCISNIRPEGLTYQRGVDTCLYLIRNALQRRLSGVQLKDDSVTVEQHQSAAIPFFTTTSD